MSDRAEARENLDSNSPELLEFLVETASALRGAADPRQVCDAVARAAVPGLAAWCAVDLVDDRGAPMRMAEIGPIGQSTPPPEVERITVPLDVRERQFGTLVVARIADRPWRESERQALALLARLAAGELQALAWSPAPAPEKASLPEVARAARELGHQLNNKLTLPIGTFEVLVNRPDLPSDAREMLAEAFRDLEAAEQEVARFRDRIRAAGRPTERTPEPD